MISFTARDRRPCIGSDCETRYAKRCKAKLSRCRVFTFNGGMICLECLDDGATPESVRMERPIMKRTSPTVNEGV